MADQEMKDKAEFDFDSLPELLEKLRDWLEKLRDWRMHEVNGFDHGVLTEAIAAVVVLQAMAKEAPRGAYHISRKTLLEMAFGEGKGQDK